MTRCVCNPIAQCLLHYWEKKAGKTYTPKSRRKR